MTSEDTPAHKTSCSAAPSLIEACNSQLLEVALGLDLLLAFTWSPSGLLNLQGPCAALVTGASPASTTPSEPHPTLASFLSTIVAPSHQVALVQDINLLEEHESLSLYTETLLSSALGRPTDALLKVTRVSLGGECGFAGLVLRQRAKAGIELHPEKVADEPIATVMAKNQFLTNMSHEIRTPLTAIIGFSEALQSSALSEADYSRFTSLILSNSRHLLGLINELLDITKIDAGALTIEHTPLATRTLLEDIFRTMEPRAAEKGLELKIIAPEDLPPFVMSDPLRMRQILTNLLANAIKFTISGSIVFRIGFDTSTSILQCSVTDTGVGIPEDTIASLFRPFQQADSSTSRLFGGTGLGLTISKQLVEALGGTIHVMSKPGQGSTFTVNLPVVTCSPPSSEDRNRRPQSVVEREPIATGPLAPVRQGKILVAEDVRDNRLLIDFLLRKSGYSVTFAENGQEAITKASSESFDVILMDIQMPVVDGYTATRELRSRGITTPIIALTAHTSREELALCQKAGFTSHFPKPFRHEALLELLDTTLATRSRRDVAEHTRTADEAAKRQDFSADADDMLSEVTHLFLSSCQKRVTDLHGHLAQGQLAQIRDIAHDLIGTAGLLNLRPLAQAAKEIGAGARSDDEARTQRAVELFESALADAQRQGNEAARRGQSPTQKSG